MKTRYAVEYRGDLDGPWTRVLEPESFNSMIEAEIFCFNGIYEHLETRVVAV